jgi:beta-xylosidase
MAILTRGTWLRLLKTAPVVVTAMLAATASPSIRPTIARDFPDPTVLTSGGKYYAFSTMSSYNNKTWHVPVQRASSLTGPWSPVGDAMPNLPSWVAKDSPAGGDVWAPEVAARSDGSFLLYYTAHSADHKVQCIGVALAKAPQGPYVPQGSGPLVCRAEDVNTIDPSAFTDTDGKQYLLYSSGKGQTTVWLQQMSVDGITPKGVRRALIQSDRPEEGNIVEAPTLVHHEDKYVLFYSGNSFNSGKYFVNYATSDSLASTFVKSDGQFLTKDSLGGRYTNPGGEDFMPGRNHDYLLFHAYAKPGQRAMFVVGLSWDEDGNPELDLGGGSTAQFSSGITTPRDD